ncbi:MAG: LUD domain-containing protein [Frisingicoccus sp.]
MREKFCTADMGVSGANVAVADTGTVFTMSNEGNGRMVGALPKIHLYIFGIEKFVKSISDARWIFKALPRNGTGQRSHLMFRCTQVQQRLLQIKRMIRKKRKNSTLYSR